MRICNMLERGKLLKEKAAQLREEKRIAIARKVLQKYHEDSAFRFLYETVSDFFTESLKADMEHLKSNQTTKVSLAAKWCPSLDSSFDKSMLLCESIARKVFPRESYPEYEGVEEAHYVYRVRDRLRKEVLVPLRKVLELPEVYMSLNKWGEIPYNRVARVAMKSYRAKFLKHDKERFRKFLADEKSRKSQIAAAAKLPHEIIGSLRKGGDVGQITDLQWKTMVDDLRMQGKFKNCMAVSDLFCGTAMAVSLGLLVSELTEEPWKGKFITFNLNPTLQIVKGETLSEKVNYMKKMETDCFLDVQKVFDLILQVAVDGKLKEEDMIKRLIVFSPMDFPSVPVSSWEQCSPTCWRHLKDDADSSWESEYDEIVEKFKAKGYGNAVPEIVFWSLRDTASKPNVEGKKGVAIVMGFSKNFLKLFLNEHGHIDPVVIMEDAICRREYQNLSVFD